MSLPEIVTDSVLAVFLALAAVLTLISIIKVIKDIFIYRETK
jgi:hypothetical protein